MGWGHHRVEYERASRSNQELIEAGKPDQIQGRNAGDKEQRQGREKVTEGQMAGWA
jgi:hypothetical protein